MMSSPFKLKEQTTLKYLENVPQKKLIHLLQQEEPKWHTSSESSDNEDLEPPSVNKTKSDDKKSLTDEELTDNSIDLDNIKLSEIQQKANVELPLEDSIPLVKLKNFKKGNQLCADEKSWQAMAQPKRRPVVLTVHDSIQKMEMPNVKIIIGDQEFSCHYLLLICYSEYFMEKPMQRKYVLPTEHVTPRGFASAYKWMITDNAHVEREHIVEVLNAANYLRIDDLQKQIWYCIEGPDYFIEFEAFLLFLEANKLGTIPFLEAIMLGRISKFFLTLLTTTEFLEMSADNVTTLFASDRLAVNTEKEVLYAAILWFNHDWPARQTHIKQVLESVRFISLPTPFLLSLKQSTDFEAVNRVILTEEFNKRISESIFGQTLIKYSQDRQDFTQIYQQFDVKQPRSRQFICDNSCPYHKSKGNELQALPDYSEFIDYLRLLQTEGEDYWAFLKTESK